MKREDAYKLIGLTARFRRDNVMFSNKEVTAFNWEKGQECDVVGFMELDNKPALVVRVGEGGYDLEDISLHVIGRELDFSSSFAQPAQQH